MDRAEITLVAILVALLLGAQLYQGASGAEAWGNVLVRVVIGGALFACAALAGWAGRRRGHGLTAIAVAAALLIDVGASFIWPIRETLFFDATTVFVIIPIVVLWSLWPKKPEVERSRVQA